MSEFNRLHSDSYVLFNKERLVSYSPVCLLKLFIQKLEFN